MTIRPPLTFEPASAAPELDEAGAVVVLVEVVEVVAVDVEENEVDAEEVVPGAVTVVDVDEVVVEVVMGMDTELVLVDVVLAVTTVVEVPAVEGNGECDGMIGDTGTLNVVDGVCAPTTAALSTARRTL